MKTATAPARATWTDSSRRVRIACAWLLPFASTLIAVVLLTGLGVGLALLCGLPVSGFEVVFAVVATGVGLAVWLGRIHGRRWVAPWVLMVGCAAGVILPNLVLGGRVLDDTWDGQWYHQEAVIQLADGWNPFRADLTSIEVPHEGARVRINGYPKAAWLWGASLYQLTHRIERAKTFSFPLLVASGFVVLACLLVVTPLRPVAAAAIALVAAANPAAVTQILNAFQDGALASLLTVVVASLVLWVRAGSRVGLVLATASAVGASAIKHTGPIYVVILVTAAVLWMMWTGRWRDHRRSFSIASALAVVGILVLSGGTYLTNTVRHGHPMYPILGSDRAPIVETPPHSRLLGLTASIFLRSQLTTDDREAVAILQDWRGLKMPLTCSGDELAVFFYPNVRIGGWGPLFGGVVLLTLILLGVAAVRRPGWAAIVVLTVAPIVVSVVVNPYCWKTRYAPQMWLVPLVIVTMILAARPSRTERLLSGALITAAGVNILLVGWAHLPAVVDHSKTLKERLLDLGKRREILEFDLQPFRSNRVRLAELGIDFTEVDDDRHNLPVYLGTSPLKIDRLDVESLESGGGLARIGWRATGGVDGYLVEAVVPGPAGPGGSILSVVRRWTESTEAEIPIPAGPVTIVVSNCNRIGCGVGDAAGPLSVGGVERRQPLLGAPFEGEVVRRPSVLFSWLPAIDSVGRSVRIRFNLVDAETGRTVIETETEDLWLEHRFAEDGQWLARLSLVDSELDEVSEVRFQTRGVAAPRLTHPQSGSSHPSGDIELSWESVPEASLYEYFVAVTGRPEATVRDVTSGTDARVVLNAVGDRSTDYSVIVRACLAPQSCEAGSEIGWGPWSNETGAGGVKLIVVP